MHGMHCRAQRLLPVATCIQHGCKVSRSMQMHRTACLSCASPHRLSYHAQQAYTGLNIIHNEGLANTGLNIMHIHPNIAHTGFLTTSCIHDMIGFFLESVALFQILDPGASRLQNAHPCLYSCFCMLLCNQLCVSLSLSLFCPCCTGGLYMRSCCPAFKALVFLMTGIESL